MAERLTRFKTKTASIKEKLFPKKKSLDRFQADVTKWKTTVFPAHELTPQREYDRAVEEFDELKESVYPKNGTRASEVEIGEEAVDVIIRMLGLIAIVNGNAAKILDKKIKTMNEKYPPATIAGELKQGIPIEVAMLKHKQAWQQKELAKK
jgi:hypothetical protein